MMLWVRIRQSTRIAVALAIALLLTALIGGNLIPVFSLTGVSGMGVPFALVLPILPIAVLVAGLTNGSRSLERVAVRSVLGYDVVLVCVVCGIALLAGGAMTISGAEPHGLAFARNVLGYCGLGLIGLRFLGTGGATVLPAGFVFLICAAGFTAEGRPHWWAWPLADGDLPLSWFLALLSFVLGTVSYSLARFGEGAPWGRMPLGGSGQ